MGFRFQKRIKIGKGFGLNISKSSITPSYRNKRGSVSKKGYSFKTGISGLTYRKSFNKSKGSGCVVFLILFFNIFLLILSCSEDDSSECETKNCSDFISQSAAQSAFDADPDCYRNLDLDNDNVPCENLPN